MSQDARQLANTLFGMRTILDQREKFLRRLRKRRAARGE